MDIDWATSILIGLFPVMVGLVLIYIRGMNILRKKYRTYNEKLWSEVCNNIESTNKRDDVRVCKYISEVLIAMKVKEMN